jgi:hypothetical protein
MTAPSMASRQTTYSASGLTSDSRFIGGSHSGVAGCQRVKLSASRSRRDTRSDPQESGPQQPEVTRRGLALAAANRPKPPDMAVSDGFLSPSRSSRTPHFNTGLAGVGLMRRIVSSNRGWSPTGSVSGQTRHTASISTPHFSTGFGSKCLVWRTCQLRCDRVPMGSMFGQAPVWYRSVHPPTRRKSAPWAALRRTLQPARPRRSRALRPDGLSVMRRPATPASSDR